MDETLSVQGRNSLIEPAMTSNFPISHTISVEALRGLLWICDLFIFGWGEANEVKYSSTTCSLKGCTSGGSWNDGTNPFKELCQGG